MSARIVFDLDGTLIDSARDINAIANASLATVGAAPISLQETRSFVGNGIGDFVAKMRKARGVPDSEHARLLSDMVARYDAAVALTVTYPGVIPALETLAARHKLGICTNKLLRPCMAVLRHLEIDTYFSTIWGGDNPLARKPDPAPLVAAFKELGDGPCLYVGDSEVDAETAERAGVPFLLFTPGYRHRPVSEIPHTEPFDSFVDLPLLVDRVLAR